MNAQSDLAAAEMQPKPNGIMPSTLISTNPEMKGVVGCQTGY